MTAKFLDAKCACEFCTAGNATVTLVSKASGTRYTYRIRCPKDKPEATIRFVSVMFGPDNEGDFAYLGFIRDGVYEHGVKSKMPANDKRSIAFGWTWQHLLAGVIPEALEVWHEGKCGRCGRKLTVPESISRGIGPECAKAA